MTGRGSGGVRRVLLALLRRALPEDWAADIVRDLGEAHERRRSRSAAAADLWLAGQVLGFVLRFGFERARELATAARLREEALSTRQDVAHTLRAVRRSPAFSAAVVGTLAVGIGANTALFSVVKTVVLDPLPYPDAGRIHVVAPRAWTPADIVLDIERSALGVEEVVGYYPQRFAVTDGDRPEEIEGAEVTPGFLRFLGAGVVLGRGFQDADARPGAPPTAVVSHGVWQRRYGGASDVIGRTIRVDGTTREIVGVIEPDFRLLAPRSRNAELWIPGAMDGLGAETQPEGSMRWAIPLARLREGADPREAQAELDAAVARHLARGADGGGVPREGLRWTSLEADLVGGVRSALLILQAAVAVVLLLACVNVANLLLVRFGARREEVAIRSALGAPRGRLVRQLLTESVVLALLGGTAGVALAFVCLEAVLAVAPADVPRIDRVALDVPVLLATLGVSVATGLLFGVVPAAAASRVAPQRFLKEGGRSGGGSRRRSRASQALVVTEITLTLVLVVGAGLLVRSFALLSSQAPGFRTQDVLALEMHVPHHRYRSVPQIEDFYRRIVERLERVPGVEAAGATNRLPIHRGVTSREFFRDGEAEPRVAEAGFVSPGYFHTLDIPLVRGRYLEESDARGRPPVAVVDRALAREVWPGEDAVGRRIRLGETWHTVVGVVGDVRGSGLANDPRPGFYVPYRQRPETEVELAVARDVHFVVRVQAGTGGGSPAGTLREAVWDVDAQQPVPRVAFLEDVVAEEVGPQRFRAALLAAFAAVALILAVAGVYGVVGHLLAQRTHELGIRRAMGATDGDVVRRVLAWGMRLAALGVALGLAGVLVVNRYLASLLFGVTPTDPASILVAVCAVVTVTLAACLVPAYRATRVDAAVSLRSQ